MAGRGKARPGSARPGTKDQLNYTGCRDAPFAA